MNQLRDVELAKAYRLLNHGPVTLVTFEHEGAGNVMAASWVMPLDFDPPKLLLVLDSNTYSRGLLEGSGTLVINLPCRQHAEFTLAAGNCTGREQDKFALFGITPQRARVVQAPIVPECLAYLECRVIEEPGVQQRHDLFVAQVIAAYADERTFSNGRWHFPDDDLRTLHYSAGGTFYLTGNPFKVPMPEGFDD